MLTTQRSHAEKAPDMAAVRDIEMSVATIEYHDDITGGIESTVQLFAERLLGPSAHKAIKLFGLARQAQRSETSPESERSAVALVDYLTSPDSPIAAEEMDYIASLLGDIPEIERSAANYQERLYKLAAGDDPKSAKAHETLALLAGPADTVVPLESWDELRFGINLPEITTLAERVNVESIISMAAMTMSEIITAKGTPQQQLKRILEAETFYAPLLDALGLSAFEMSLRNEANKARLIAAGREDLVQKSRENLEPAVGLGLAPVIEELFGKNDPHPVFNIDVCKPPREAIAFTENRLSHLTDGQYEGRVIGRIKTAGSNAHKMLHNPDYQDSLPQDVFGFTVIVEDEAQLAEYFNVFHGQLQQKITAGTAELKTAPSKKSAIYTQGTPQYIERLQHYLDPDIVDEMQSKIIEHKPVEETFQVLKVTFDIRVDGEEIPVEMQFQVHADRYNARLGGASHVHYKGSDSEALLGNITGNGKGLAIINSRKAALYEGDPNSMTPVSTESINRFQAVIERALHAA